MLMIRRFICLTLMPLTGQFALWSTTGGTRLPDDRSTVRAVARGVVTVAVLSPAPTHKS
jgi:hypothetical protein